VAGVYISYPFCAQKCTYCNFASGVFPRALERRYVDALLREIRGFDWGSWAGNALGGTAGLTDESVCPTSLRLPETVYLGGGTPGNMAPDDLRAVLEAIPGRPWIEATIEAAPGGITGERAGHWIACGINRVSLGVQSFVEKEIRRTGRKHTAHTVEREMQLLRAAGIASINIDLIAGLPGQTEASWRESLDWIERLAPEHVSVYMLEVDEDSRLGKEMLAGGARYGAAETPDDDRVAALYEMAVERLAALGLHHYEISNFARAGWESRHNLKYWRLEPYAGFGADAHSFDGKMRRRNAETVEEYVNGSGQVGDLPHAAERFFVGLRLMEGIRPAADEWQRHDAAIRKFLDAGLLETADGVLRLSSRGVLVSNVVLAEFV
jgi:oxygen-independent coproporphyrinogen-3 oxidase